MKMTKLIGIAALLFLVQYDLLSQEGMKLAYEVPAKKWTEALPIGNGNLGAMVYGGAQQEHIQFNEETLWRGQPHDYSNKGAGNYLAEIRQLLTDGKQVEAHDLATKEFMSEPLKQIHYQPFGDIYISFDGHEKYSNYSRTLDIENAVSNVSYKVNDVVFEREVFSSFPDKVMVVHLTSSKSKALSFKIWLDAIHEDKQLKTSGKSQTLEVKIKDGVLKGVSTIKVDTDGILEVEDGKLKIVDASKATIYMSAVTNYINFKDVSGNPYQQVSETLKGIESKKFGKIKKRHIKDYQSLYNRFQLDFGDNGK